jgi:hypothetical protein
LLEDFEMSLAVGRKCQNNVDIVGEVRLELDVVEHGADGPAEFVTAVLESKRETGVHPALVYL